MTISDPRLPTRGSMKTLKARHRSKKSNIIDAHQRTLGPSPPNFFSCHAGTELLLKDRKQRPERGLKGLSEPNRVGKTWSCLRKGQARDRQAEMRSGRAKQRLDSQTGKNRGTYPARTRKTRRFTEEDQTRSKPIYTRLSLVSRKNVQELIFKNHSSKPARRGEFQFLRRSREEGVGTQQQLDLWTRENNKRDSSTKMLLHNKEHKDQKDLAKNNSEQTKICLEKQIRKAQRKVNNTETLHLNPGGTQEVRASIPTQESQVLTRIQARIYIDTAHYCRKRF